jgi:hypothetical protein
VDYPSALWRLRRGFDSRTWTHLLFPTIATCAWNYHRNTIEIISPPIKRIQYLMPPCPKCSEEFDTERGVRTHHSMVHDEPLPNRTCSECEERFHSEHEKNTVLKRAVRPAFRSLGAQIPITAVERNRQPANSVVKRSSTIRRERKGSSARRASEKKLGGNHRKSTEQIIRDGAAVRPNWSVRSVRSRSNGTPAILQAKSVSVVKHAVENGSRKPSQVRTIQIGRAAETAHTDRDGIRFERKR